ncbi:hypothetical protein [Kribbella endophytica]
MTLRDALVVISYREQFDDLGAALALLGVGMDDLREEADVAQTPLVDPDLPEDDLEAAPAAISDGWWGEESLLDGESSEDDQPAASGSGKGGASTRRGGGASRQGSLTHRQGVIARVLERELRPDDGPPPLPYLSVPLPGLAQVSTASEDPSVFRTRTLSSTLHSMMRTWHGGFEPDIEAIVAHIARLEPLSRVPTIPRRGQPDRIAVLCELGLRSGPYRDDVNDLLEAIRRLFGDQRLTFMAFRGSPALGCGAGPVWTWEPYVAQPQFAATMVISIGVTTRDSDPEETHLFAMQEVAAGREVCTVLIGASPAIPAARAYPQLLVRD